MLLTRFTSIGRHTHTLKRKGKAKEQIVPSKSKWKKALIAIHVSDKIDFKTLTVKRQRKTLHNGKGVSCKYLPTQHRNT